MSQDQVVRPGTEVPVLDVLLRPPFVLKREEDLYLLPNVCLRWLDLKFYSCRDRLVVEAKPARWIFTVRQAPLRDPKVVQLHVEGLAHGQDHRLTDVCVHSPCLVHDFWSAVLEDDVVGRHVNPELIVSGRDRALNGLVHIHVTFDECCPRLALVHCIRWIYVQHVSI